jgi:hypothetical protein
MAHMTISEQFELAFRSAKPYEALRAVAEALLAEGRPEKAVYDLFEAVRAQLRLESRETEEDLVMEVMDCLVGWCAPHQKLTSTPADGSRNGPTSPGEPAPAARGHS